ncbi:MAG TPA: TraB/GumN family protein [Myxococcota bacterium]|jgi:pheromone shutdown-related protein TraB
MQSPQAPRGPDAHPDLHVLDVDGREFLVVGTAHISRESAELVREVIERERPDRVCLELDRQRYEALSNPQRWDALDVKQLIRDRQLAALVANLMLAAYQKKLGGALGVKPGAELLAAGRTAEALGIPVSLCDRDVRVTLRRAWASLSLWKKSLLLSTFLASALEKPQLSEEDLRELRQQDVVSKLMAELAEFLPALKRVLIDERDRYLAQRMREAPGRRVVAVVGAGHVAGVLAALREPGPVDLAALDRIPPVSAVTRWLGWGIPASIVAALVAIGVTQGAEAAARDMAFWVLVTGIPCTLGAAAAFAHPITIAAAFFTAPVTTLSPVIGAGHVLALVQAWVQPPMVAEFERLAEDFTRPLQWWRNRLLRVLLVFILTTLGTMLGVYIGGWEIVSKLFGGGGA